MAGLATNGGTVEPSMTMRHLALGPVLGLALLLGGCAPASQPVSSPGMWELRQAGGHSPESTTLHLNVSRLGCSNGVTGQVLEPDLQYMEERILIRTDVAALDDGAYNCPDNDQVPVTVELTEPIGRRQLVDAVCLDAAAGDTTSCEDGGIRWRP